MAVRVIEIETTIEDPQMEEALLYDIFNAANDRGDPNVIEWFRVLPLGMHTQLVRDVIRHVFPVTLTPREDPA